MGLATRRRLFEGFAADKDRRSAQLLGNGGLSVGPLLRICCLCLRPLASYSPPPLQQCYDRRKHFKPRWWSWADIGRSSESSPRAAIVVVAATPGSHRQEHFSSVRQNQAAVVGSSGAPWVWTGRKHRESSVSKRATYLHYNVRKVSQESEGDVSFSWPECLRITN